MLSLDQIWDFLSFLFQMRSNGYVEEILVSEIFWVGFLVQGAFILELMN